MLLERRSARNGVIYYVSPLLERGGVRHGFSTRIGGVSPPPFDALNLGNPSGTGAQDDPDRIAANAGRFRAAVGCADAEACWVHQVHGCGVLDAADPAFTNGQPADALVSSEPGHTLTIRVADCVPILLASRDGRHVAAVHAGWRGVVAGVAPATVAALHRAGVAPADLVAAIGPCISHEAFEVGPEVIAALRQSFGDRAPVTEDSPGGKGHADLRGAVRLQLLCAGLAPERIDTTDRCTVRDADEFFSHRRNNGITGRMAAAIAPRA